MSTFNTYVSRDVINRVSTSDKRDVTFSKGDGHDLVRNDSIQQAARNYLNLGLSVIPVNHDKTPVSAWKRYQTTKIEVGDVPNLFKEGNGIAIVCGSSLEIIDIDCKYDLSGTLYPDLMKLIGNYLPEVRFVIASTRNGGYHLYYRCEKISSNSVFARNEDHTVLIESRGEGGYVVAFPTPGYRWIEGSPAEIPQITPEQRECLFSICRSFDKEAHERAASGRDAINRVSTPVGLSPFDDYNQRGSIESLMHEHGWKFVYQKGNRLFFLRAGRPTSKTSGNFHIQKRLLTVFSSSTPFEAGKAYNLTQAYCILNACSFAEASRQLYDAGYGTRRNQ